MQTGTSGQGSGSNIVLCILNGVICDTAHGDERRHGVGIMLRMSRSRGSQIATYG